MRQRVFVVILIVTALAVLATLPADALAQEAGTDPIACWWRTSASAIRIGQPFDLVLTCAVFDNGAITVIPDESGLDGTSMQLPPFEIIRGRHPADLRTPDRRFFQYDYTMRLIGEDSFGKDIALPELQMNYKVQTRVNGEAVQGRTQTYLLPKLSVRVLSMVPNDAVDIRDAGRDTFEDINARTFRADVFLVASGVLFALAGVMALVGVVRLVRGARKGRAPVRHFVSDGRILRGAARELAAVRREREASGWTESLAARAAAALRIAAAHALGSRVSQTVASNGADPQDGQILLRRVRPGGDRVFVSSSVTGETLAKAARDNQNGNKEDLEPLQVALARFTASQYNRPSDINADALDESLSTVTPLLRRLSLRRWQPGFMRRRWAH